MPHIKKNFPLAIAAISCLLTAAIGAMSPQEINDRYATLLKNYRATPLIKACLEERQDDAIKMLDLYNINEQEPRFGTMSCLYEINESTTDALGAGEQHEGIGLRKRRSGYTPLHYSIINHLYVLFAKLLQKKAINPNLQDADGNTPLHHAVLQVAPMFVYDLAQHENVNPYLANNDKQNPIALAYQLKDRVTHPKKADDLRVIINILNTAMDKTTFTDNPFVGEDSLQLDPLSTQSEA